MLRAARTRQNGLHLSAPATSEDPSARSAGEFESFLHAYRCECADGKGQGKAASDNDLAQRGTEVQPDVQPGILRGAARVLLGHSDVITTYDSARCLTDSYWRSVRGDVQG